MRKTLLVQTIFFVCCSLLSLVEVVAQKKDQPTEVFVVATLYSRHSTTPVYDLKTLQQIITTINPTVLVLDVSPKELREQKVFPGKIEYPGVIFPFVNQGQYKTYAAEPDEPVFSTIVNSTLKVLKDFETDKPELWKSYEAYAQNFFNTLRYSWASAADVNSDVTDKLIAGKNYLHGRLAGPQLTADSNFWNRNTADAVAKAVRENPGTKVLVLIGIDNCFDIRKQLSADPGIHLVHMEQWLRDHNF